MEQLGVLRDARDVVVRYTESSLQLLDQLPQRPALDTLRWLLRRMQARMY